MSTRVVVRSPPGRAGVLWLRRRLAAAEAGSALLARKLTVLTAEASRLADIEAATGHEWRSRSTEAQRRLELSRQLDGERTIMLAASRAEAQVTVSWDTLMGLRYPRDARCAVPERPPDSPPDGGNALALAESALRMALPAAARHAAAAGAVSMVRREIDLTRQRRRALERRRIPALRTALAQARAQVEDQENADAVRRRWADHKPDNAARRDGTIDPGENALRR